MMILRSAPASPFARKVRIAAGVLGLDGEMKVEGADTNDTADPIRRENPLGKIPSLLVEDGNAYYDSRVILAYLDHRAGGGKIVPADPVARLAALRLEALADGLTDASILVVYEARWRPADKREQKWLDHQAGKAARALAGLEQSPPTIGATPTVGDIALACALGYRDFRFEGAWRADHPRLVAWLDDFAARVPSFAATRPPVSA
jgi:glutathione S-transferase